MAPTFHARQFILVLKSRGLLVVHLVTSSIEGRHSSVGGRNPGTRRGHRNSGAGLGGGAISRSGRAETDHRETPGIQSERAIQVTSIDRQGLVLVLRHVPVPHPAEVQVSVVQLLAGAKVSPLSAPH